MQLSQSQSSLQQLQHQFSQEREHLRMQLDELQTEHQRRQQRLQEVHCCAIQDLEHARQRDLKVGGSDHAQTHTLTFISSTVCPTCSSASIDLTDW